VKELILSYHLTGEASVCWKIGEGFLWMALKLKGSVCKNTGDGN